MSFSVEQGGKQSVIGCFLSEHEPSSKSFRTPSWIPEQPTLNKDAIVPELFAVASERLAKCSPTYDPALKLAESLSIPHWMSSDNVQSIHAKGSTKSEMTPDVAPCTPMPSFSRQKSQIHETPELSSALPSLCLGFGPSERQQNQSSQIHFLTDSPNSQQLFSQQLPAKSAQTVFTTTPSESLKRVQSDVWMDGQEFNKEDLLSLLLHKQEKQPHEYQGLHPAFSLGHYAGELSHQRTSASSRVSKFSFLEGLASGEAHSVQLTQHRDDLHHRMPLEPNSRLLVPGMCNAANKDGRVWMFSGSNKLESGLVGSKKLPDQSKSLIHCSSSPSKGAEKCVLPQKTNVDFFNATMNFPFFSQASPSRSANGACTVSCLSPMKQEWNGTSTECAKYTQLLPNFFAQQKVTVAAKIDGLHAVSHDRGNPEKRCKIILSQKSLASGASQEYGGFNVPSIDGLPQGDQARKSAQKHRTSEHQKAMGPVVEALDTKTQWCGQPLQNSFRHVDLSKVKLETQSEDTECSKSAWKECMEKHGKIISTKGKSSPEVAMLNSCPTAGHAARYSSSAASDADGVVGNLQTAGLKLFTASVYAQMHEALSTVSAGVPSLPFSMEKSQKLTEFEGETTPVNRGAPIDGDWGKFLALSATPVGQTAETETQNMLPFQRRFKQLQEFLKQCDGSDQKYCLQALRSLSAAARSDHAVELETRAVRLSLEEGKEIKRMKLLNVLGKFPEGTHINANSTPLGPRLPAPGATTQVSEEA